MSIPYKNITVYGAGGSNIGKHILSALLSNNYTVSVLSRNSSKSKYPTGVKNLRVSDDLPHSEIVKALKGQDVVISAVGFSSSGSLETQFKVIDAAIEAGVKRFMPSEYGFDNADPKSIALSPIFKIKSGVASYLQQKADENSSFSWTGAATGIWLEWALEVKFLGIDTVNHTVAYWNQGTHKPAHTTLTYAAQGIIEILKHPEETKNKRVFMEAFTASQREIVAELEKQQGVKYEELPPVIGTEAVKDAHHRWNKSSDFDAAITTVVAEILMEEYGANFVKAGKKPILEDFAVMPKVTLEDVVKTVVSRQV